MSYLIDSKILFYQIKVSLFSTWVLFSIYSLFLNEADLSFSVYFTCNILGSFGTNVFYNYKGH